MKWYFLLLLLFLSNACERHPVSDLALIEGSKTEGVRPQPERVAPELETTAPSPP